MQSARKERLHGIVEQPISFTDGWIKPIKFEDFKQSLQRIRIHSKNVR